MIPGSVLFCPPHTSGDTLPKCCNNLQLLSQGRSKHCKHKGFSDIRTLHSPDARQDLGQQKEPEMQWTFQAKGLVSHADLEKVTHEPAMARVQKFTTIHLAQSSTTSNSPIQVLGRLCRIFKFIVFFLASKTAVSPCLVSVKSRISWSSSLIAVC